MIAIVLAAGRGTRLNSNTHKTLQKIGEKPMIRRIFENLQKINELTKVIFILGHQREQIENEFRSEKEKNLVEFVYQDEQLGTGHAIKMAYDLIKKYNQDVLITNGDLSLVKAQNYIDLTNEFLNTNSALTILSIIEPNPFSYGRIIKENGLVTEIKEQAELNDEENKIQEVNAGIYIFKKDALIYALDRINNNNKKGEYYLTDAVSILKGEKITSLIIENKDDLKGVNTPQELYESNRIYYKNVAYKHLTNGVKIYNIDNVFIEDEVEIEKDTVIHDGVHISGKTKIGKNCEIYQNTYIKDSIIEDEVIIKSSYIEKSHIKKSSSIGPFANIRPETVLNENVHVGNFVEVKKSVIHENTKVGHLTYIGDSNIGKNTNIGAGTITCNYDGKRKHQTTIGSHSFIGSNTILVSPVNVGNNSTTAAGSVITKNVPDNSLSFGRSKQVTKTDYYNLIKEDGNGK